MAGHGSIGTQGEEIAAQYLRTRKYEILQRNYRCRHGEIDIIARRKKVLVFIEVKTRRSDAFGAPQEAVSPRKQRAIGSVALDYLQRNRLLERAARFDVIAIRLSGTLPHIEHIENAFELTDR